MKNIHLITTLLFVIGLTIAQEQVIISDDATYSGEASAILDIKSIDKGLLFPRVELSSNLTSASPVTSPAEGLIIYNIGNNQRNGFYIWNGSFWQPMNNFVTNISSHSTVSIPGIYLVDAGSDGVTVTIPDAAPSNKGNIYRIYKTDGNANVTIQSAGNQYIGGGTAQVISQNNKGLSIIANYTLLGAYHIIQDNRTSIGGNNEYGEMYEFNDNGTVITCGTTAIGWTTANSGISSSNINFVNNTTSDRLTVSTSGIYKLSVSIGFSSNTSNVIYTGTIFKNNAQLSNIKLKRKISTTGDFGSASLTGLISLEAGDYIDLRFSASKNNSQIAIEVLNLNLFKISE